MFPSLSAAAVALCARGVSLYCKGKRGISRAKERQTEAGVALQEARRGPSETRDARNAPVL